MIYTGKTNARFFANVLVDYYLIGLPFVLLFCDGALLGLMVYDLIRFSSLNLSFWLSFSIFVSGINFYFIVDIFLCTALFFFIPPLLISLIVLQFNLPAKARRWRFFRYMTDSLSSFALLTFRFFISLLLALFLFYTKAMATISGVEVTPVLNHTEYESLLNLLLCTWPGILALSTLSVAGVINGVVYISSNVNNMGRVLMKLEINRAKIGLYPVLSGKNLVFNAASAAPEIPHISREIGRKLRSFQIAVPSGKPAKDYLLKLFKEAKSSLLEFFGLQDRHDISMNFLPGTSRALEVAIKCCFDRSTSAIILSPYEHPLEMEVARWFLTEPSGGEWRPVQKIDFSTVEFLGSEEQQFSLIIKKLVEIIAYSGDGVKKNIIFIISEVSAVTGDLINLRGFFEKLDVFVKDPKKMNRKNCPEIRVIVDGAHAAGNIVSGTGLNVTHENELYFKYLNKNDRLHAYVTSGHKWMMSSEPCGILLTRSASCANSYDSWGGSRSLPGTTTSPRALAGLISGLALLKTRDFSLLLNNALDSKGRFKFWLKDSARFKSVTSNNDKGTLLITIMKKPAYEWRSGNDADALREYFEMDDKLFLTTLSCGDDVFIRVSFVYFVEPWMVNSLIDCLDRSVQKGAGG